MRRWLFLFDDGGPFSPKVSPNVPSNSLTQYEIARHDNIRKYFQRRLWRDGWWQHVNSKQKGRNLYSAVYYTNYSFQFHLFKSLFKYLIANINGR